MDLRFQTRGTICRYFLYTQVKLEYLDVTSYN